MPLSKYFGGKGASVMRSMRKKYGSKRGESVFYATVNKMKSKDKGKSGKKPKGGRNAFFGNDLPFQLGDGERWFKDSRGQGKMFTKKGK